MNTVEKWLVAARTRKIELITRNERTSQAKRCNHYAAFGI
jgi:hypothetical protein